jgi:hypothetical protein
MAPRLSLYPTWVRPITLFCLTTALLGTAGAKHLMTCSATQFSHVVNKRICTMLNTVRWGFFICFHIALTNRTPRTLIPCMNPSLLYFFLLCSDTFAKHSLGAVLCIDEMRCG